MLVLKNIVKDYSSGDTKIRALNGVSFEFRESEFVAVLGPSGCGKTTLLNIIGGLDRYTSGDLFINGKSTKDFKDSDWDTYRNHSIGFVFQSYNLIPHQTVLANVELALTLSGVTRAERRTRAKKVLEQVGLGDQIYKKPNQLSGGQMQRVAIARALINDPDILLADEPTGALDTETSIQVMDILKEISKEKLVIMVTHNPDLANRYATRIIGLLDGKVISDSNTKGPSDKGEVVENADAGKKQKTYMSFITALSLSLNNLMTKKTRTILTAFAGSIGIIGIALILALSNGFQSYIDRVEENTLSSYPVIIEKETVDMSSMFTALSGVAGNKRGDHDMDKIYSSDMMVGLLNAMAAEVTSNNLTAFKEFIESDESGIMDLAADIKYSYKIDMNIYRADTSNGLVKVNPSPVMEILGMSMGMVMPNYENMPMSQAYSNTNVWSELLDNERLLRKQYDLIAGEWPKAYNEVVMIVDENNEISDYTLYSLGIKDQSELPQMMKDIMGGKEVSSEEISFTYNEILDLKFKMVLNTDFFVKEGDGWVDKSQDEKYMKSVIDNAEEIRITGIIRPSDDSVATPLSGIIGYTPDLTRHLIDAVNESEIARQQLAEPDIDVFTGLPFTRGETVAEEDAQSAPEFDMSSLTPEQQQYLSTLSEEELAEFMRNNTGSSVQPVQSSTYEGNLSILGVVDLDEPNIINIYPLNFEAKEQIIDIINDYNTRQTDDGRDENVIQYTDYVGLIMSSVSTVINTISYVLMAFVAISLVVSSIMIGIITYISVLERTKEIGILRSIGASKRDISRVFNAETLIIGFAAGILGIGLTLLLTIPINIIIDNLAGITNVSKLPAAGAVILVIISMALTFIAGLIPSRIAANKNPVEALRTE